MSEISDSGAVTLPPSEPSTRPVRAEGESAGTPQHRVRNRGGTRFIATYSLIVGASRVAPALGFLTLTWSLSLEEYGRAAVLASVYALLVASTDSGFDAAASIRIAAGDHELSVLAASLRARLVAWGIGSCIGALLLAAAAGASDVGTWAAFICICLGALVTGATSSFRVIEREHRPWLEARLVAAEKLAIGIAIGALGWLTKSVYGYAIGTIVAPLLVLIGSTSLRGVVRHVHRHRAPAPAGSRAMLRTALPIGLGIYASLLYWRVDVLIISRSLGEDAAGVYAQGYYPIMAAAMVPGSGAVLLLRRAARETNILQLALIAGGTGALVGAAVSTLGRAVLDGLGLLTEPLAAEVLPVAAMSLPFVFVNPFMAMFLRSHGFAWRVTVLSLTGLVLNVGSVAWLVSSLGVIGAAWASVVTEATLTMLLFLMVRFVREVNDRAVE